MNGINFVFISKEHSVARYNLRCENMQKQVINYFNFFFL
jgi:hypothetical protein